MQEFGEFWSGHSNVSKTCTFTGPFSANYIIYDLKKYWGVIFRDTEEQCKIWRKTSLRFGKWYEDFGKFSSDHSKTLKIYTLMSCFWSKYNMFELKTYREFIFDGTEYWCKIWRKNDLCFQKRHEEFCKFLPKYVWKFGLLLGPFIQSRKCMSLKFTGDLCLMTMKNDVKFE